MPAGHDDLPALEVRVVAPRSAPATNRRRVEVCGLERVFRIRNVEDAQTRARVRLVHQITFDVQVVIDLGRLGDVFADKQRVVQIGKVEDHRPRAFHEAGVPDPSRLDEAIEAGVAYVRGFGATG